MRLNTFVAGHQPLTQRGFDGRESAACAEMGAGAEHDAPPPSRSTASPSWAMAPGPKITSCAGIVM